MRREEAEIDSFFEELIQMELFADCFISDGEAWKREELCRYLMRGARLMCYLLGEKLPDGFAMKLTDKQKNHLASAVEYLSVAFVEEDITRFIGQLPLLLCLAEFAQNEELSPVRFKCWWEMVRQT